MTAPAFEVPAFVQARVQRRADSDARIGHGQCIYGCRAEAHLYPGGTFCDEHSPWQQAGQPRPGAAAYPELLERRRVAGQYRTASMPTISDTRAEASGKRDPNRAARRAAEAVHQQTLTQQFTEFHTRNPHVMDRLEELIGEHVTGGATRLGMGALFEQLRGQVETNGRRWQLDNSLRADYARALVAAHPEWAHLFEVRQRRSA